MMKDEINTLCNFLQVNNCRIEKIRFDTSYNVYADDISIYADNQKNSDEYITSLDITFPLDYNKILDYTKFPIFPELITLTIINLNMKEMPSIFFDFPKLEHLAIKDSSLNKIPKNFNLNNQLKEICFDNDNFEEFPVQLKLLKNLEILRLAGNKFKGEFPKEVYEFKSLRHLDLSNNEYVGEINIPYSLEILKVECNFFNKISCNSPTKLNLLYARFNGFTDSVFEDLANCTNNLELIQLDLNFSIETIPSSIKKLNDLNNLSLVNCNLKSISNEIFFLNNLEIIDLSYNPELTAKLINFASLKQVEDCLFINTNITCYEEGTCVNIDKENSLIIFEYSDKIDSIYQKQCVKNQVNVNNYLHTAEQRLVNRTCSKEEVDSVVSSMKRIMDINKDETSNKVENNKNTNILSNKIYIISIISSIILGLLVILWWRHYKNHDKRKKTEHNGYQKNSLPTKKNSENNYLYNNYSDELLLRNNNLPVKMESNHNKNINSNIDTIPYDDKKHNNENIVNAEFISNLPSNYYGIVKRINNNVDNNISHQSLPPYTENSNNNDNEYDNEYNNEYDNKYDGDDVKLINDDKKLKLFDH